MTHRVQSIGTMLAAVFIAIAGAVFAPVFASAQGVEVALLPAETNVGLGVQFDIEVTIPDSSAQFNAFELEITYDDTLLTLVSNQQGPLVTGACGNRFHVFDDTDGIFTTTVGLLCAGTKVSGPGTVYTLRFQTGSDATITWIRLEGAGFSDAGVTVNPVTTSHALVRIGNVTAVPGGDHPSGTTRLRAYPNPFHRAVNLNFASTGEGPIRLDVYSVSGRLVRRLWKGESGSSPRTVTWDGTDDRGNPVSRGIYLVRMVDSGMIHGHRIVKVH